MVELNCLNLEPTLSKNEKVSINSLFGNGICRFDKGSRKSKISTSFY